MRTTAGNRNIFLKCLMVLIVVAASLYRKPELFTHPRFFAEEGTFFFSYAFNNSFIDNLLHPQFGYYTLYNAIVTSFAATFPLEHAPLVTTIAALIMQLTASVSAIRGDLPLLNSHIKRFVVALSFPLLCPGQIWLTTIGVQYWLCIITALVLLEAPDTGIKFAHRVKAALLLLNGLTGILSCLMTPLFIYKWRKSGARQMLLYSATLGLCSGIQLIVFLHSCLKADGALSMRFVERFLPFSIYDAVVSFFYTYLLNSCSLNLLMETKFRERLDVLLSKLLSPDLMRECESMFLFVGIASLLLLLPFLLKALKIPDARLLILATLLIYPLSIILSISSVGGPRYVFAPGAILLTAVVGSWDNPRFSGSYRLTLKLFIALCIVLHWIDFRTMSMYKVYQKGWPEWRDEVALWRSNPEYPLKIWPPSWTMQLNPEKHRGGGR